VRALAGVLTLAACALAVAAEAREIRLFSIKYRPVREVAALVEPLLSPEGSITIQPQFNLLTVQDTPEAIARVGKLLAAWDVPPSTYKVRISVLLGTALPPGQTADRNDSAVGGELLKVFHFSSYREIETVQVTATDGAAVEANVGEPYHLRFTLRTVPGDPTRVQLSQLEISRRQQVVSGGGMALRPVLRTTVSLELGQTAVVGAARSEGASEGLVLVMGATQEPTK
jgi:hypothetical protein